jgi:hypothetical protein
VTSWRSSSPLATLSAFDHSQVRKEAMRGLGEGLLGFCGGCGAVHIDIMYTLSSLSVYDSFR